MKIVILGGGGFIGSTIADRLLQEQHELRIFERPRVNPYRSFSDTERIEWVTGDFQSKYDITNATAGADIVLHLVSTTLPKSSNDDPIYDVQTNLVATLQLLDAMVENNIQKIVFISSGGTVYGKPENLPINEKHPTNPFVSYGISKLTIEKYLLLYQHMHNIKPVILRVSNPFGPRQRIETAQGAVGVFLHNALNNKPIEIWGNGSVIRDYVYIADVAESFVKAINYNGRESIFNIGSGAGRSLKDIISAIEQALGKKLECHYHEARSFDVQANVLDNSLACQELGWQPLVSFNDGIKKTITWLNRK